MPDNPPDRTIAVVDDNEMVRRSMVRMLRTAGYGVTEFSGGAEFIDSLRSARPACVVLDLEMPGLSGLDVLAHLARQPMRVPAIVVTGHDSREARRLAATGGAADYFTKPVEPELLLTAIGTAIETAAARNDPSGHSE